ncbi:MAG: HAD-IA family hydrolase [Deltaproteobacteria bacterium]|nr:HAD-IA family hydrolase [Deltaproteobacteria bacterium]
MAGLNIKQTDINTIIFDFDGTLAKLNIDFQQMHESIEKHILSYGIKRDGLHSKFVLEMIETAKAILINQMPHQADTFLNEANAIIENIEIEAASTGELFEHTKELLKYLDAVDISCGIITRNCNKAVKIVFPEILSYCAVVICRDDVKRVKPHPEHITTALEKLGSSAGNTLMIGDHPLDIKTGRNAGTKTCGVLTGHFQKDAFLEAGADIVLAQASDLLNIIK